MRIYIQMTVRRDLACADRFPTERLSSAMFKSQTRRNSALVARLVESCCFCLTLLVVSLGTLPVRVQAGDATWLNAPGSGVWIKRKYPGPGWLTGNKSGGTWTEISQDFMNLPV